MSVCENKNKNWTISVDCESMGLFGTAFGAALVVYDPDQKEIDNFIAYADYKTTPEYSLPLDHPGNRTKWIETNVIPAMPSGRDDSDGGYDYLSLTELRNNFWTFYRAWVDRITTQTGKAPDIIAEYGFPVEAGFFRECIMQDLGARMWQGPFPLHEVNTRVASLSLSRKS